MAWTKAKIAVTVGVGVLLAAGTTTAVVERISHRHLSATNLAWADDPRYWELNSRKFDLLPPVYILRPTHFPNSGGSISYMDGRTAKSMRLMNKNTDVAGLITTAFDYDRARCVFPEEMPGADYDLMFSLPEDYHQKLKEELRTRFGLTAHTEKRVVDVWVLKVKTPDAPGLKISTSRDNSWSGSQYEAQIRGNQISNCLGWLEETFGRPILNQTGLRGHYDMDLKWKPAPGQSEKDALREALLDQIGLELVPDRAPINLLIVEKVK